jgi:sn-glycerol 3-phosphate transport system ATP-binding protein
MAEITLRNVRKSYAKTEVVHGVDLDVAAGEFIVILGPPPPPPPPPPSGCGKSTLLRMVAGLESITEGEIELGGKVVNQLEPRERGCAMVFQNYALYPHMTVGQNIGYSLKIAGVPRAKRDERVGKVAASLGLEDFLDRRPAQLSGGQRQRVAMGRAIDPRGRRSSSTTSRSRTSTPSCVSHMRAEIKQAAPAARHDHQHLSSPMTRSRR